MAWNSGWMYYQSSEFVFVGPRAPPYFHSNNVTEWLRHGF
jgi:hypothetical protein